MRKVTIKEIAQMAGVSPTTVSFVINDRPGVSDKVRERVREIIRREQFTPNLSSRRLVQGRSYNICFLFHQTSSPFSDLFYWELAKSLLDACNEYGYNMMLCDQAAKGGDDPVPDIIRQRDVDAVVCFQSMHDAVREALRAHGIPYVIVDAYGEQAEDVCVKYDCGKTAEMAVRFLSGLGHRRIGFIGAQNVPGYYHALHDGYLETLRQLGLPYDARLDRICAPDAQSSQECMLAILADGCPDAMFFSGDLYAVGAMGAVKAHGLSIPGDISFVGTDDLMFSTFVDPPLTTIRFDQREMGAVAMRMLISMLEGQSEASLFLSHGQLVVRESSTARK